MIMLKEVSFTPAPWEGANPSCGYVEVIMHLSDEEWDLIQEMLKKANPRINGEETEFFLRFVK